MDGVRLLAARFLRGTSAGHDRRKSPPGRLRKAASGRRQGQRTAGRRPARGKRLRGAACLVETVTLHQHRARPGRPAPSPNFPAAMPERASACPVFENQENATKISATTATSTVRVMKVSMAAVPNEA